MIQISKTLISFTSLTQFQPDFPKVSSLFSFARFILSIYSCNSNIIFHLSVLSVYVNMGSTECSILNCHWSFVLESGLIQKTEFHETECWKSRTNAKTTLVFPRTIFLYKMQRKLLFFILENFPGTKGKGKSVFCARSLFLYKMERKLLLSSFSFSKCKENSCFSV